MSALQSELRRKHGHRLHLAQGRSKVLVEALSDHRRATFFLGFLHLLIKLGHIWRSPAHTYLLLLLLVPLICHLRPAAHCLHVAVFTADKLHMVALVVYGSKFFEVILYGFVLAILERLSFARFLAFSG